MNPTINPGPVFSAGKKKLNEQVCPAPSMRGTVLGWFKPLTMIFVTTTMKDGQAQAVERELKTSGMIQAGDPEKLEMKAEGERSWEWFVLHTLPNVQMQTDDRVSLAGVKYRVMSRTDWAANGFMRYNLIKDYQ